MSAKITKAVDDFASQNSFGVAKIKGTMTRSEADSSIARIAVFSSPVVVLKAGKVLALEGQSDLHAMIRVADWTRTEMNRNGVKMLFESTINSSSMLGAR